MKSMNAKLVCRFRPSKTHRLSVVPSLNPRKVILRQRTRSSSCTDPSTRSLEYAFNGVSHSSESQSELFTNWVLPALKAIDSTGSLCLIAMGPAGSGKSFTVRGNDSEKRGVLLRTAEFLLQQSSKLKVYVKGVANAKTFALCEAKIKKIEDLHNAIHWSLQERVKIRAPKEKMHLVFKILVCNKHSPTCQLDFVELGNTVTDLSSRKDPLMNILKNSFKPSKPVVIICCVNPELIAETKHFFELAKMFKKSLGTSLQTVELENIVEDLKQRLETANQEIGKHEKTEEELNFALERTRLKCKKYSEACRAKSNEQKEKVDFQDEIDRLNEALKEKSEENESLKQMLSEKDAFICDLSFLIKDLENRAHVLLESNKQSFTEPENPRFFTPDTCEHESSCENPEVEKIHRKIFKLAKRAEGQTQKPSVNKKVKALKNDLNLLQVELQRSSGLISDYETQIRELQKWKASSIQENQAAERKIQELTAALKNSQPETAELDLELVR